MGAPARRARVWPPAVLLSAPVDEHWGPEREPVVEPVHGRGGDADASVAGRERRHVRGAVQSVAPDEEGRPVEQTEDAAVPAVDLALDPEAALRGVGDAHVAVHDVLLPGARG